MNNLVKCIKSQNHSQHRAGNLVNFNVGQVSIGGGSFFSNNGLGYMMTQIMFCKQIKLAWKEQGYWIYDCLDST